MFGLPALKGNSKSPRENVYYYRGTRLMALRKGPWKAHFATQESYTGNNKLTEHDPPVLYNLEVDPSEQWDVAEEHPEIIAEIKAVAVAHGKTVVAVPSQLEIPLTR